MAKSGEQTGWGEIFVGAGIALALGFVALEGAEYFIG